MKVFEVEYRNVNRIEDGKRAVLVMDNRIHAALPDRDGKVWLLR